MASPGENDVENTRARPLQVSDLQNPSRLIRSRRRRYLERTPSYYASASAAMEHNGKEKAWYHITDIHHALIVLYHVYLYCNMYSNTCTASVYSTAPSMQKLTAQDPLSYDRLIRQHQSAAEREAEGKSRGWARTLESSLLRGEAKLASVQANGSGADVSEEAAPAETASDDMAHAESRTSLDWSIAQDPSAAGSGAGDASVAKALAESQWRALIAERFVHGLDDEFEYALVDADETLDADEGVVGTWTDRRREEEWFDDEEPDADNHSLGRAERELQGQTGIQDF